MKHLCYPLIFLLFLFSACEKEDSFHEFENETTNLTQKVNTTERSSYSYELLSALPWASYITAKILQDSANVQERNYVISKLNNGVIPLENLIGNVSVNGMSFKNKFKNYFNYYSLNPEPDPGDGEERPPCPNCDSMPNTSSFHENTSGNKSFIPVDYFPDYASFMLNDNCVELYFPNGIIASSLDDITSLGHPLTNASNTSGIRRYIGLNPISDPAQLYTIRTESVLVNDEYAAYYENIIVARPVRSIFLPQCGYSEYTGVDFTSFLE